MSRQYLTQTNMHRWAVSFFVILATAITVRADVVATQGRPPAIGVTLLELRDGQLHYRLLSGRVVSRPIEKITYLQVTGWPLFNLAEKQQRDAHLLRATSNYEKVLAELADSKTSPSPNTTGSEQLNRNLLILCRLTRIYDAQRRFDRAVQTYLKLIEDMPACVETLRPGKLPSAGSFFLRSASQMVASAIQQHGQDAISTSLTQWRSTWPQEKRGRETKSSSPKEKNGPDGSVKMQQIKTGLVEIQSLIDTNKFERALERIAPLQNTSAGTLRPDLFYWQGRALHSLAAAEKNAEAKDLYQRRAGLAFMRVVIHYASHPYAAECLYRAAELCEHSGQLSQANWLWSEVVRKYAKTKPWAERAQKKLKPLRADKSKQE